MKNFNLTKLLILGILSLLFSSCESNEEQQIDASKGIRYAEKLISQNIDYYAASPNRQVSDNSSVRFAQKGVFNYQGNNFHVLKQENNAVVDQFKIENYLLYSDYKLNDKRLRTAMYLRYGFDLQNELKFLEIINIKTGKKSSHSLFNGFTEQQYTQFRNQHLDPTTAYARANKDPFYCFNTFDDCFKYLKDQDDDPLVAVLCDWLPCSTGAYMMCLVAEWSNMIVEETGCGKCDIVLRPDGTEDLEICK